MCFVFNLFYFAFDRKPISLTFEVTFAIIRRINFLTAGWVCLQPVPGLQPQSSLYFCTLFLILHHYPLFQDVANRSKSIIENLID